MIAVVGTGLSGLTMAAALAHAGFDVTLVGPRPKKNKDGRTTAILAPHVTFMKKIGVWPHNKATTTALTRMELVDGSHSVTFHCTDMHLPQFGFNVANAALADALVARLDKTPTVTWRDTTVTHMNREDHGWALQLAHGKTIYAALVIGADGRHSIVRSVSHIDTDQRAENQSALVVNLTIEKPHRNVTVERYRAGGPFTLVPASGNSMALVWCDDNAVIDNALAMTAHDLGARITALAENRFGAMTPVTAPQKWPINPQKARTMVAANTALVGEAAHILPPIGAQGFNTSIADIIALVGALENGRATGLPPGSLGVLQAYERSRAADVTARYHSIVTMNDIIRTQNPIFSALRRVSLRLCATLPPIRNTIMRIGLGA